MLSKADLKQEVKSNLYLSLPFIASQTIYSLSGFIGTAMVAHLGQAQLAANILVSMLWFTLSTLFFGILNAINITVSHQFGAKDKQGISRFMGQAYIVGIFMSILMVLLLLCLPHLLPYSHQPSNVLNQAKFYTYSLVWTVPSLIYLIITQQFLAGIGKTKVVLTTSVLIVPLEIAIIYILMFGKLGLPSFGISALGYGFALSYFITAIGLTLYIHNSKSYKNYRIYSYISRFHIDTIKIIIKTGLPLGFVLGIEVSGFAILTLWMGHFGTTMLAAHQIIMQFLSFLLTLFVAMSQAVTIRLGHLAGAGYYHKLSGAIIVGLGLGFFLALFIVVIFNIYNLQLLGLDINVQDPKNKLLISDALNLFAIVTFLLIIENFRIISNGALRGLKDTISLLIITIISFGFVGLPVAYVLGFYTQMGGHGLWWGFLIGIAVGAMLMLCRLCHLLHKSRQPLLKIRVSPSDSTSVLVLDRPNEDMI